VIRDTHARRVLAFSIGFFGLYQLFPSLGVESELIQTLCEIHTLHLRESLKQRSDDGFDESLGKRAKGQERQR
jgi:hypothetical protein